MTDDVRITEAPGDRRYELRLGDELVGVADYRDQDERRLIVHVGVDPAHRHHGLAGRLTAHVLDDVRARGLTPVPVCSYVAWYVRRHPEAAA
jgi:predicted GNAT family acetyltransferase